MYSLAREVWGGCGHAEPNSVACVRVVCTYFSYIPTFHTQFHPPHHFTVARWYCFENEESEKYYLLISNGNIVQYKNERDV
jgi:hypothetical protein